MTGKKRTKLTTEWYDDVAADHERDGGSLYPAVGHEGLIIIIIIKHVTSRDRYYNTNSYSFYNCCQDAYFNMTNMDGSKKIRTIMSS